MAINYAVWGNPETWVDGTSAEQNAEIKFPMSTRETYKKLWDNGFLSLNDIDTSEFFYGIGKDCIWSHPRYLYCYKDDGSSKYGEKEVLEDIRDRPIMFSLNTVAAVYSSYSRRYKYGRNTTPIGNQNTSEVVMTFNYQKLMLIPYVSCIAENASTTTSATTTTLYDYIENEVYLTKPWIVAIGYKLRYGEGGETNRSSAGAGFKPLFDYQIMPYTVLTDSYYFWASAMGCGILRESSQTSSSAVTIPCGAPRARYTVNNDSLDDYTGFANRYCVGEGSSVDMFYYDDMWSINVYDGTGTTYWAPYPYLDVVAENADTMKKYILKQIAFLGLPFVYDPDNASRGQIGNIGVYLPVFNDNGITTGDYKEGVDALRLTNSQWTDSRSAGYNPGGGSLPSHDTGDLNNYQLHNLRYEGSNHYYLLTQSELTQFISFINGLYVGESDPSKKRDIDFMGSNPTDYIVGIYGMGIELQGGANDYIKLGAIDTSDIGLMGSVVPGTVNYYRTFGDYDIPALGNFMDYKPYTQIEVYVPLCGTIEVDPADYVGHNLSVDALIDLQTGELTARIVRDHLTVTNTLSGSCWVQLPVTAAKMGDYQNNQHQLRMQMLSSVLSFTSTSSQALGSDATNAAAAIAGGGSGSGGVPSPGKAQFIIPQAAAGTALDLYNSYYQITHTQPTRSVASSASSGNALDMYHHAMVFIKRPQMLEGYNQEQYAHTVGHACCITGKLSSFSGYTIAAAAALDEIHTKSLTPLQATAEEKQLLKRALQSGIYI